MSMSIYCVRRIVVLTKSKMNATCMCRARFTVQLFSNRTEVLLYASRICLVLSFFSLALLSLSLVVRSPSQFVYFVYAIRYSIAPLTACLLSCELKYEGNFIRNEFSILFQIGGVNLHMNCTYIVQTTPKNARYTHIHQCNKQQICIGWGTSRKNIHRTNDSDKANNKHQLRNTQLRGLWTIQPNKFIYTYISISISISEFEAKFLDFQMAAAEIGDAHTFHQMIQHSWYHLLHLSRSVILDAV